MIRSVKIAVSQPLSVVQLVSTHGIVHGIVSCVNGKNTSPCVYCFLKMLRKTSKIIKKTPIRQITRKLSKKVDQRFKN